jgi:RNA polymerase sporulation-specific sigma factor
MLYFRLRNKPSQTFCSLYPLFHIIDIVLCQLLYRHYREGNEISLIDILGNDADSVMEEVELKLQIKKLYNKMKHVLKSREKKVIELRYGLFNGSSKTQREIAKILGISRSYVSRIEKKAIKKLSKELKPESCF